MRLRWLIALGVGGGLLVRHALFEGIYIASDSMSPTLTKGTQIMVRKFFLQKYTPKRGDIVMFDSPVQANKGLVKRIIAIEGDSIELAQKEVILNGELLVENYVVHSNPSVQFQGDTMARMVVPKGHVFVMGDNRDVSGDSRDWKDQNGNPMPFVPVAALQGLCPQPT